MTHPSPLVLLTPEQLRKLMVEAVADALAELAPGSAPPSEVMTRAEAAAFLRCSLATLDRLCREEALPFHRLGDCRRFNRGELLEWLTSGSASRRTEDDSSQKQPREAEGGHSPVGTASPAAPIPAENSAPRGRRPLKDLAKAGPSGAPEALAPERHSKGGLPSDPATGAPADETRSEGRSGARTAPSRGGAR